MAKNRITTAGDRRTTTAGDVRVQTGVFFDDVRQAILDGLVSGGSGVAAWNAQRPTIPVTAVVRTSSTVVTITLPAEPNYDTPATETVTATLPASALSGAAAIVATPAFSIAPVMQIDQVHGSNRPFPFLPGSPVRRT